MRQPFPGPGLAIRVIGEITKEKLDTLRLADFIFRDEVAKAHLESSMELLLAGGGVHQILCGLRAAMHIGQLELRVLELAQALAELDALLGILDGLVNGALSQAQGLRGDADTAAVQRLHGDLEALALLAQQVFLGDNAVGEHDLGGGGAVQAHLLFMQRPATSTQG